MMAEQALPYEMEPDWRLSWDMIQWGKYQRGKDGADYQFYLCWWNWLDKERRYWGFEEMFYDGPHRSFGLWFTNITWSTQWTRWPS